MRRNVGPSNDRRFPGGTLLATQPPISRRFRMSLKRLWYLTLPVFLLVGGGSAAEALTPPYALTATAVSSGQIRLSWGAFNRAGTIISYAWRFGDGGTASGVAVTHAYATPGTYTATLTVTDSRGSSASDTAVVRVADRPPVANAGPDQSGIQGSAVTFRGSGSDQDGTVTSYTWNFGDGASAAGATASHAYATAGTYTAKLTVTDDRGATGSDSALVAITGSAAGTPWARGFGGAASDVGYGVAVDASGNAVMTGRVESTVDFGGGVVCPPAAVFVSKYSPTGATMWSKCLGGVLGGGTGRAVAVDGSGNVLVTGKFSGTIDFGTGALTSAGPR